MNLNIRILGFTLAEVLITIGIIGIVAEVTIPTIITNIQRQDFATLFQKNYSNLQSMLKMYMAEQGVGSLALTNLYDGISFNDTSVQNELDNTIRKYFKVIKTCRADSTDTSCSLTEKFFSMNNSVTFASGTNYYAFITNDGIETFIGLPASCSPDFTKTGKMKADCGTIYFDVNGTKGPNVYGKDTFGGLKIDYDGTIYPVMGTAWAAFSNNSIFQWSVTSAYCGSTSVPPNMTNVNGLGCAARIIESSWKIDYW